MKQTAIVVLIVIIASCWIHIQARDFNAYDDGEELDRQPRMAEPVVKFVNEENFLSDIDSAMPIAEKIISEVDSGTARAESRTGRQFPLPPINPALNLLIQIFADIRTNCAYTPQNLPIIPGCPDTLTCAGYCRATPSCTHFTQNNTDSTCRRTSLISISLTATLTLLPTTQNCNCGYILERATPPSLLSLALLIGANII